MSSLEMAAHQAGAATRGARVRAYLHRFFTSWVADDPMPQYSTLDRADGLGMVPDPVCTPRTPLPESAELVAQRRVDEVETGVSGTPSLAVGRAGL